MQKEWELQKAYISFLRLQYPDVIFLTVQSEGKRTPKNAAIAKAMGLTAGLPDVIIPEPLGEYTGLAIELKVGTNKLSKEQSIMLARLKKKGWAILVAYDLETAIHATRYYFGSRGKKAEPQGLFPV